MVKVILARWTDCQEIGEACMDAVLNISKGIVHNGLCCLLYNALISLLVVDIMPFSHGPTYVKWVQPGLSISVSNGSKSLHNSSEL